jgi:hypothetical protein
MTLAQIEDEIRSLRPSERIELYRWLDYFVVADCGEENSFCSRVGMDRSLAIRQAIDQKMKDCRPNEGETSSIASRFSDQ